MDRNYKSIGLNSHWSDVVNIVSTSRDRTHNWNTICNKLKFKIQIRDLCTKIFTRNSVFIKTLKPSH